MKCRICSDEASEAFVATILGKHRVKFFRCGSCEYLFSEQPYWLDEAYSAAITRTDTGLVARNLQFADALTWMIAATGSAQARFLDYGGGLGLLTRLMRDRGFDFYWHDPFCANVHAVGFEYARAIGDAPYVTAFEVIEHSPEPMELVREALAQANSSTLFFSTVTYSGEAPPPLDWWYYSFDQGQHVSLFSRKTLKTIADKLGKTFTSSGALHVISDRPFSPLVLRLAASRRATAVLSTIVTGRSGKSLTWSDHEALAGRAAQK